jgi:hypothetical protein
MKKILIIGATSAIAVACARIWSIEKAEFFLVGRNLEKLQQTADDLRVRGAVTIHIYGLDVNQFESHAAMFEVCYASLGQVDIALIAHGTLPNQTACEQDVRIALQELSSNGLSVIALLTLLANRMEAQSVGTIAVISSVAGDRGRASNYLYGTAKAAVSTFCEGLRVRLFNSGVHVLTIKPGFVDTPMTHGLSLPKALVVSPEKIANDITKAINKNQNTLYTPWFWKLIMLIIIHIPSFLFKRIKL